MATAAARRLTAAHKLAQARIGTQTVARMRAIWRLLDPDNLDGSFDRWLTAALAVIQAQRSVSADTAIAYLNTFKTLELGAAAKRFAVETAADVPDSAATSLLVTGPLSVKRAMTRGVALSRAMAVAEAASAAAAMRHAMDGGRETITATVRSDRQGVGWERVAGGKACVFCAGLDGKRMSSDDVFAAHDGCSCAAQPVYRA